MIDDTNIVFDDTEIDNIDEEYEKHRDDVSIEFIEDIEKLFNKYINKFYFKNSPERIIKALREEADSLERKNCDKNGE